MRVTKNIMIGEFLDLSSDSPYSYRITRDLSPENATRWAEAEVKRTGRKLVVVVYEEYALVKPVIGGVQTERY